MKLCPNCGKVSITDFHEYCLYCFQSFEEEESYNWIPVVIMIIWILAIAWAVGEVVCPQ